MALVYTGGRHVKESRKSQSNVEPGGYLHTRVNLWLKETLHSLALARTLHSQEITEKLKEMKEEAGKRMGNYLFLEFVPEALVAASTGCRGDLG